MRYCTEKQKEYYLFLIEEAYGEVEEGYENWSIEDMSDKIQELEAQR